MATASTQGPMATASTQGHTLLIKTVSAVPCRTWLRGNLMNPPPIGVYVVVTHASESMLCENKETLWK